MKKLVSTLALAVAIAGLGQAASVAKPLPTKSNSDVLVEHKIQAKFAKSKINAEHFTVSVHNGIATIEGKTNVIQHKGVATRLAKTGGAAAVQNHILISDAARAKAAASLAGRSGGGGTQQLARATVVQPGTK